jgi:hypothetical protein
MVSSTSEHSMFKRTSKIFKSLSTSLLNSI